MTTKRRWFWGSFFILGAGLLVASRLGWISAQFGFWQLLTGIFLLAIVIFSVAHRTISGTVFGLAFLAILFAKPLGITALAPWTILGVALLVTIGLSLILNPHNYFKTKFYSYRSNQNNHWNGQATTERMTTDEAETTVRVNMSSSIRYLQSQNFTHARIDARLGNVKLYLTDVRLAPTGATIDVSASLSGVELYLPKDWPVKFALANNLADIDEKGQHLPGNGPTVVIQGNLSLSGLVIYYV